MKKFLFLVFLSFFSQIMPAFSGDHVIKDFQEFTLQQKLEDFKVLTGAIDEYYGMLDYKEKRFGFNWEEVKNEYLEKIATPTMTREEFASLMQELIAKLADGHTGSYVLRDYYLHGVRATTLGFLTERVVENGKNLAKVKKVYPKFFEGTPVKEDDQILSIDGRDPEAIVKDDLLRIRNLGQDESNLTLGFHRLTTRMNYDFSQLPSGTATIVLKRGDKQIKLNIPWVAVSPGELEDKNSSSSKLLRQRVVKVQDDGSFLLEERKDGNWDIRNLPIFNSPLNQRKPMNLSLSTDVLLNNALTETLENGAPEGMAVTLDNIQFKLLPSQKGMFAVLRIPDFTPFSFGNCTKVYEGEGFTLSVCTAPTAETLAQTFQKLKGMGINTLVLDLRSNPGGYLDFGYEIFKVFAKGPSEVNLASIRLNEEWVGDCRGAAESSYLPVSVREEYRKIYQKLLKESERGEKYSSPVSIMGSKEVQGVENGWDGKTLILVDEMCASMCDIFTTLMQDHKLATVVGKQTMGAGGNVIEGPITPHTKVAINLTASRIFRLDGSTIENEGAKPDIAVETTTGSTFWDEVKKAVEAEK